MTTFIAEYRDCSLQDTTFILNKDQTLFSYGEFGLTRRHASNSVLTEELIVIQSLCHEIIGNQLEISKIVNMKSLPEIIKKYRLKCC